MTALPFDSDKLKQGRVGQGLNRRRCSTLKARAEYYAASRMARLARRLGFSQVQSLMEAASS